MGFFSPYRAIVPWLCPVVNTPPQYICFIFGVFICAVLVDFA